MRFKSINSPISEAMYEIEGDELVGERSSEKDRLLDMVQQWIDKRPDMKRQQKKNVIRLVQPLIDAIHEDNPAKIKHVTKILGRKSRELEGTPHEYLINSAIDLYNLILRNVEEVSESVVNACKEAIVLLG